MLAGGSKVDEENKPVAPRSLCRAFQPTLTELEVDLHVKLLVLKLFDKHVMGEGDGWYPIPGLNDWEKIDVRKEIGRLTRVGWYRNPSVSSADSLGITYRDSLTANWRAMHPDFIVFNEIDGKVVPSIVDPHGTHLEDALTKLRGLARYAIEFGDAFHRIDSVASGTGGELRVLDMKKESVRDAVLDGKQSAAELFAGSTAEKYA